MKQQSCVNDRELHVGGGGMTSRLKPLGWWDDRLRHPQSPSPSEPQDAKERQTPFRLIPPIVSASQTSSSQSPLRTRGLVVMSSISSSASASAEGVAVSSASSTSSSSSSTSAATVGVSVSSSGSASSIESSVAKTESSDIYDSCMWYGGEVCGTPRSCYDCLNVNIASDSCAIDPYGECVSMSQYEDFVDSRNYYVPNYRYFPSTNYSYCSSDDALCADCTASWKKESYGSVSTTYCQGQDGCVCVSLCEVPDWETAMLSMNGCYGGISTYVSSNTTRILIAAAVGISVAMLFFGVAYAVKRYVRTLDDPFTRRRAAQATARAVVERREPRTGPLLGLDGWKSMREKLIETERAEIQGGAATMRAEHVEDAPTEAAAILVEEGDAYRPLSPSEMGAARTGSAPTSTNGAGAPNEPVGASTTSTSSTAPNESAVIRSV